MNTTPEQDPWDRIHDADRDDHLPTNKGPSVCTIVSIIVGILMMFGFAFYGLYRVGCAVFHLAP